MSNRPKQIKKRIIPNAVRYFTGTSNTGETRTRAVPNKQDKYGHSKGVYTKKGAISL